MSFRNYRLRRPISTILTIAFLFISLHTPGVSFSQVIEKPLLDTTYIQNRLIDNIIIPFSDRNDKSSNYIFPVILPNSSREKRDRIRLELQNKGIQTSVHYPAVHRFTMYSDKNMQLPDTEYVSDNIITLPMYSSLTINEIDYICETLTGLIE